MRWEKLGLVYCAGGEYEWAQSHAFIPTSMMLDEERIRVYVAFLDRHKVGRIGFVDLDADDPRRILRVSEKYVLDVGKPGTFDDSGVTPMCLLSLDGRLYLYYVGWQMGVKVRYYLFMGLAVSEDGGESFRRISQAPILDRSDGELFVRSAANVLRDGDKWRMWYIAGSRWIEVEGKQVPTYNMRYLESDDHTTWNNQSDVCLELAGDDEFGFGRPYVVREDGVFRMWYSIRTMSRGYRLGYAESDDGQHWKRKDAELGIDVSASGWDSEMICFSCIQKTRSGTYMFYNGNNYGETGFGVARLQS
jgi:predicted GH43/DUF377 family glycosyl hydrolase